MVKKCNKGQPVKGKAATTSCKSERKELSFYEKYNDKRYIEQRGKIKLIVAEEKGMVYRLKNEAQKKIFKYKIDGGLIQSQKEGDNKCDYGIYTEDKWLILVELKGRNYNHAVTQILSTIKLLELEKKGMVDKLYARAVLSNAHDVPKIKTSDEAKLDMIIKGKGGNVKKQSQKMEEKLSSL